MRDEYADLLKTYIRVIMLKLGEEKYRKNIRSSKHDFIEMLVEFQMELRKIEHDEKSNEIINRLNDI